MNLIQSISSTLKTWVFKKKLLKFSDRYAWETQACFYCPEMCRFSCPVAETLRHDGTTPRGKMSLLHLAERGVSDEQVAGSSEQRLWFLEQCTGCGRCTEYCVYENDVGSHLRRARADHFAKNGGQENGVTEALIGELRSLQGVVLLCEPDRKQWWQARPEYLRELGVATISDAVLPHKNWAWGKLAQAQMDVLGAALAGVREIWVESPEAAWFIAKGLKEDRNVFKGNVRVVWQKFFSSFSSLELKPGEVLHESYHLSRLFPHRDYSIPMYERGLMPFHHGWNVIDCGGEGYYKLAHPEKAQAMGERFLFDLEKDGRKVSKIICQNRSCLEHLKELTGVEVTYWLDALNEVVR